MGAQKPMRTLHGAAPMGAQTPMQRILHIRRPYQADASVGLILDKTNTVRVVEPNSVAEQSGLVTGHVLLTVDGVPLAKGGEAAKQAFHTRDASRKPWAVEVLTLPGLANEQAHNGSSGMQSLISILPCCSARPCCSVRPKRIKSRKSLVEEGNVHERLKHEDEHQAARAIVIISTYTYLDGAHIDVADAVLEKTFARLTEVRPVGIEHMGSEHMLVKFPRV
jgi:hypothetical protein